MNRVFGIVFADMHDYMMNELTAERCMGSVPVGGRYQLIDFALSGLTNSGIQYVGVITKSNYRALNAHLGNGREWDLSRKHGGLVVMPPAALSATGTHYGRIQTLYDALGVIRQTKTEFVLLADCNLMANIDYGDFVNSHIRSGADITVMYHKKHLDGTPVRRLSTFLLDREGWVTDMLFNPETIGEHNVYLNNVILSRDLLEWIIHDCHTRNMTSFKRDVLQSGVGKYKIHSYEFAGYTGTFDSVKSYFTANMALLDPEVRGSLFPKERPIYTRVLDEAPVRYGLDARVENSLLADGCLIEGEVENSLLFRGVTVGKGAKVKNCILMQGTHVGADCDLNYIITDREVHVKDKRTLMGYVTYPVYISEGARV